METIVPITSWKDDDKPREKLMHKGAAALSDAELVAILIATGSTSMSAVDLARAIMKKAKDSLLLLGKLPIQQLKEIKGVGTAKAVTLMAALELGKRRQFVDRQKKDRVCSSKEAAQLLIPLMQDLEQEKMYVLYLNHVNMVVGTVCISSGGISSTIVDVKLIIRDALHHLASKIILAHNHPSGSMTPSVADTNATQKIKKAAALLDIQLVDHLIIAEQEYFSFADAGIL